MNRAKERERIKGKSSSRLCRRFCILELSILYQGINIRRGAHSVTCQTESIVTPKVYRTEPPDTIRQSSTPTVRALFPVLRPKDTRADSWGRDTGLLCVESRPGFNWSTDKNV